MQGAGVAMPVEGFVALVAAYRLQHDADLAPLTPQLLHTRVLPGDQVRSWQHRWRNVMNFEEPALERPRLASSLIGDFKGPGTGRR